MRVGMVLSLLVAVAAAQETDDVADRFRAREEEAFRHYHARDWERAVAAFERQIAVYPDNPRPYYNIACCYALQGRAERAATWLGLAIRHDWRDEEHLRTDPDFDSIRGTPGYARCLAQLAAELERRPDPLPQRLPPKPDGGSLADYMQEVLAESSPLLSGFERRRRLFAFYDRRMASYDHHLAEEGDGPRAPLVAYGRVHTAMQYLDAAEPDLEADRHLVRVAAGYVLLTSEEFLQRYAGSTFLAPVLFRRGYALERLGRGDDADTLYQRIVADHPAADAAARALIRLCARTAADGRRDECTRAFAQLEERFASREWVRDTMRRSLGRARLIAKGLPEAYRVAKPTLLVFVSIDSPDSERTLARIRREKKKARVFCVDPPERASDDRIAAWFAQHAEGLEIVPRAPEAIEELWLTEIPTTLDVDRAGLR